MCYLAVSHRYLMPTAALLARRHQVGVLDLPGFGLSGDPGAALDTGRLADTLRGWLHATGTTPAVLLGNSYGCQVIVDVVARHPEVAAAVVLSGPTTDPQARTVTRQVLRWLREAVREDPLQAPILLRDVRNAGPGRVLATLRHAVRDRIDEKLPAVAVPALVVRGGVEPIVPARWADEAARLLPLGRLAVLPGSPHNSVYVAAAGLTAAVEAFLDHVLPLHARACVDPATTWVTIVGRSEMTVRTTGEVTTAVAPGRGGSLAADPKSATGRSGLWWRRAEREDCMDGINVRADAPQ